MSFFWLSHILVYFIYFSYALACALKRGKGPKGYMRYGLARMEYGNTGNGNTIW